METKQSSFVFSGRPAFYTMCLRHFLTKKIFLVLITYVLLLTLYHYVNYLSVDKTDGKELRIAIFIQGNEFLSDKTVNEDIIECVANIGDAREQGNNFYRFPWEDTELEPILFDFDIFIAYDIAVHRQMSSVRNQFQKLGVNTIREINSKESDMSSTEQFLWLLQLAESHLREGKGYKSYDIFLTIDSRAAVSLRRESLESLCGTPALVISVLKTLRKGGVVVPQGLVIKPEPEAKEVALMSQINLMYKFERIFSSQNQDIIENMYGAITGKSFDMSLTENRHLLWNTVGMFWSHYSDFKVSRWARMLPMLSEQWHESGNYKAIELAVEILFLMVPYLDGVPISEIGPAIKPIAIYFPQYHQIPENDAIHGEGFTEWTLLKPATDPLLAKPLSVQEGGLGYYDLTDRDVRRKQSEMARAAGIHGFMYYHYWFSGQGPYNFSNPVMGKIPELMIEDGYPDLPFFFSWANEPWTSRWSGEKDDSVLLPQEYGDKLDWEKHFYYLLRFFKHPKYMTVKGKPVFVLYRLGHFADNLKPMIQLWRRLARANGFSGLHIVFTINNFLKPDRVLEMGYQLNCDAAFHFHPTIRAAYKGSMKDYASSMSNVNIRSNMPQYWGAFSTFDTTVRVKSQPSVLHVSSKELKNDMKTSFSRMLTDASYLANGKNIPNLFFITAWNEWNEQAVLEPSDKHGFSYLSAVKASVENQAMIKIKSFTTIHRINRY